MSLDIYYSLFKKAMDPENFLASLKNQKFSDGMKTYLFINNMIGRSGSFFVFSPCKNFILKTVEKSEAQVLKNIIPDFADVCSSKESYLFLVRSES